MECDRLEAAAGELAQVLVAGDDGHRFRSAGYRGLRYTTARAFRKEHGSDGLRMPPFHLRPHQQVGARGAGDEGEGRGHGNAGGA